MRRFLFWFTILLVVSYALWMRSCQQVLINPLLTQRVEKNYGKAIEEACKSYKDIDPEYFKALAILEVSARLDPPSRTEKKVWERLIALQKGERKRYSFFTTADLKNKSATDLKFMATSWGPFQIMGFHAVQQDFPLKNLRNEQAVKTGIAWCMKSYGKYLKKKDYRNAFHIHNTGRPLPMTGIPFTTDPDYVEKGMRYMQLLRVNPNVEYGRAGKFKVIP